MTARQSDETPSGPVRCCFCAKVLSSDAVHIMGKHLCSKHGPLVVASYPDLYEYFLALSVRRIGPGPRSTLSIALPEGSPLANPLPPSTIDSGLVVSEELFGRCPGLRGLHRAMEEALHLYFQANQAYVVHHALAASSLREVNTRQAAFAQALEAAKLCISSVVGAER
jgi:hypothetical protein